MAKLQPLGDVIVVRRDEPLDKTPGGILLPDSSKEKPVRGKVLAVGPGRIEDGEIVPINVKDGDMVLFGKYAGNEVEFDGENYTLLHERDVLGKVVPGSM